MKNEEAMTFAEYTKQKLTDEFCSALTVASGKVLDGESVKLYMEKLAKELGGFVSKQGYKPSEKVDVIIKVPSSGATCDPLNPFSTMGGEVECNLTATKDQYVFYASEVVGELKEECKRQIEKIWKDRLMEDLDSKFNEKYPYIDLEHDRGEVEARELIDRFTSRKNRLVTKIEKMVEKFKEETL